ncbi:MAG: hypothetical protein ACOC88_03510, partial [Candidatus Bipolaricaulota bacterium]
IGAPAGSFLPQVADLLGTEFVRVENYSVGNAVGAIAGEVVRRFDVLVIEDAATDQFIVFLPDDREVIDVDDEDEAMENAREMAVAEGKRLARESGGREVTVTVEEDEFKHGRGHVHVTAVGQP